jgi:hypothetical protein
VEKQLALNLRLAVEGSSDSPTHDIAFAWGVSTRTIQNIRQTAVSSNDMSLERKKRNDTGQTVFNNDKKRKAVFSDQAVYEKEQRKKKRGEQLTKEELVQGWENASPNTKKRCQVESGKLLARAPYLVGEIQAALLQTSGSITWQQLAAQLSSSGRPLVVSHQTIMRFVMGLPDSSYATTRIGNYLSDQELDLFAEHLQHFPDDSNVWQDVAEAYLSRHLTDTDDEADTDETGEQEG